MSCTAAAGSCVAIVDPFSTGSKLVAEAASRGYGVIVVWTAGLMDELKKHMAPEARTVRTVEVQEEPTVQETAAAVCEAAGELRLAAVIVGADTGVTLADALSEALGLRTNGSLDGGRERRNKRVQQELLRAAGLRAVREAWGTEWSQLEAFVEAEGYPVVLKPTDGAGSFGVKLCYSRVEAEAHFHRLMAADLLVGHSSAGVLAQEYLRGPEYVVDHVSRDGAHKTMNLCVYDKRPCNGAEFVYCGWVQFRDYETAALQQLIGYTRRALDALGIRNGPSHAEVIMASDGPCLVEMNCRMSGADGCSVKLQSVVNGYSQVDATLDAFLDAAAFARTPDMPPRSRLVGHIATLVARRAGRVLACPGLQVIRAMPSFVSVCAAPGVGDTMPLTVDCITAAGSVILAHEEYLRGPEYVVDHVSRDGAHKAMNLCVYDKRPCNGAEFVYFGLVQFRDYETLALQQLIGYTRRALDALGIRNRPSHAEVIMTSDGPCLVEMNCRMSGADGCSVKLQSVVNGYSQVDATLDAFLDAAAFARTPDMPPRSRLVGHIAMLVARRVGRVLACPGFQVIRAMPSFVSLCAVPGVGDPMPLTVDCITAAGSVILAHEDPDVLAADIASIRAMDEEGAIFEVEASDGGHIVFEDGPTLEAETSDAGEVAMQKVQPECH